MEEVRDFATRLGQFHKQLAEHRGGLGRGHTLGGHGSNRSGYVAEGNAQARGDGVDVVEGSRQFGKRGFAIGHGGEHLVTRVLHAEHVRAVGIDHTGQAVHGGLGIRYATDSRLLRRSKKVKDVALRDTRGQGFIERGDNLFRQRSKFHGKIFDLLPHLLHGILGDTRQQREHAVHLLLEARESIHTRDRQPCHGRACGGDGSRDGRGDGAA